MVEVRRVRADEWRALRDVRLRSLADAPDAFGSTYAESLERPDEWWRNRAAECAESDDQTLVLAWNEEEPVGIAGAFAEGEVWFVISMWVDPAWRRSGMGRELLDAAVAWLRSVDDRPIRISVTDGNDAARRLYEDYGFRDTGASEPLRSNPKLMISELELE
jgi:GNAT superfamily N-acetyltransferase